MTCNCTEKQLDKYEEFLTDSGIMAKNLRINNLMFSSLNCEVTGSLSYDVEITLKNRKVKTKTRHINLRYSYCPFCGKAYE